MPLSGQPSLILILLFRRTNTSSWGASTKPSKPRQLARSRMSSSPRRRSHIRLPIQRTQFVKHQRHPTRPRARSSLEIMIHSTKDYSSSLHLQVQMNDVPSVREHSILAFLQLSISSIRSFSLVHVSSTAPLVLPHRYTPPLPAPTNEQETPLGVRVNPSPLKEPKHVPDLLPA